MNPGHGAGVAAADRRHLDDLALDELDPIVFAKNPGLAHPVVFIEREASAPERDRHGILSVDHLALPPCVRQCREFDTATIITSREPLRAAATLVLCAYHGSARDQGGERGQECRHPRAVCQGQDVRRVREVRREPREPRARGLWVLLRRRRIDRHGPPGQQHGASRALRQGAAQRPAGRRHQVARRAAERARQDSGRLRGLVVRLPARRARAGAAGRSRRAGAAHLQPRRQEILGTRRPDPAVHPDGNHDIVLEFLNAKNGGEWASVPIVVIYTRDFQELHRYIEYPAIYHKDYIRGYQQSARAGETETQTKERGQREFVAMQGSPFFDVWASAGIDEILSALYEKLTVKR